jgi:transcriptional repressor NrdR
LFEGIEKNLTKRPFTSEQIDKFVSNVEARIYRVAKDKDIQSSKIGEIVMNELKKVDKVAYIRFAAVYREFADLDDFKEELKNLK